jgi:hypothetical protein
VIGRQALDVIARDGILGLIDREHADVQGLIPVGGAEAVVPGGPNGYAKDQQEGRDADIAPHVRAAAA